MPISSELLEILCDPVTKQPVEMLAKDKLATLNAAITAGQVKDADGNLLQEAVQEALITTDGATIYRIDRDIPIMLAEHGIATKQIDGF